MHVPAGLSCVAPALAQNTLRIRHVDIIHHSHTDVGFTDLPSVTWHKQLAPAGETSVVFRDSAFADDMAKTNLTAILQRHGLENVRSL